MEFNRNHLLLYLVTDRRWAEEGHFLEDIEAAIRGGVTMVQLRDKDLSRNQLLKEAIALKEITEKYNIPLLINDDVDIALAADADGVHVGQKDMPVSEARKLLGPGKIIGTSARTTEQALQAQEEGADYLGVGQVFQSSTKLDTVDVSHDTLKYICESVSIPVAGIGGIAKDNLPELAGTKIAGAAVASAVLAQKDIESAARELKDLAAKVVTL